MPCSLCSLHSHSPFTLICERSEQSECGAIGGKNNMTPKYVVYECENCGELFYRDVEEVITDDGADCHVKVILLPENETGELEEFPMCECLRGIRKKVSDFIPAEAEANE